MFKFTKNQLISIETNNKFVVVSASAGSGKTSVMVERIIKLLKSDNIYPTNLLIITFTKNSTLEIRNRIAKKINCDKIVHGANFIDSLSICTIDSLCVNMIKQYTRNKYFRILSEKENLEIIHTIIQDNIYKIYKENNLDFISSAKTFNDLYNNKNFIDAIINQLLFISNIKDKNSFWDKVALDIDLKIAFLNKYIKLNMDFVFDFLLKAVDLCQFCSELGKKYSPIIKYDLAKLERIKKMDLIELIIELQDFNFTKLKSVKESKLKSSVQNIIKYAKIIINDLKIIDVNAKTAKNEFVHFADLIKKIDTEINEYKRKYDVFSFSDIEFMLLNMLKNNSIIKKRIQKKYKYILVDEYQDVNAVQNNIFDLIAENLFVVGDYKQSIYGFRGAIPEAFYNKKKCAFSIDLSENFRSNDYILKFVNDCFSQIMTVKTNLIDYKMEKFKLKNENMNRMNDKIHLYLLDVKSEWKKIIHEIEFVADIITKNISEKKRIYGRNIQFSDFCILVRNYNKYSDKIYKIFKKKNIEIRSNNLSDLFNYNEIYNLILLLESVVDPLDDINLSALLMGPIFNFSNFELTKIRGLRDECEFYFSMKKYCLEHDDIISEKCKLFFDFLGEAEHRYRENSLTDFIFFIIDEIENILCNYYRINNNNFLILLHLTQKFEQENSSKNIQKLIDYIKNQTYDVLEGVFELDDAVSVTSIHKAKGKEYPICFLIGCGDEFLKKCDDVMFDAELGISFKSDAPKLSIERYCMEASYKYKTISEEMRLLYVALTRAKEELHIILSSYNADHDLEKASLNANMFENIHPYFIRNAKNFYEWFLMIHFKFEEYNFKKIDFFDKLY